MVSKRISRRKRSLEVFPEPLTLEEINLFQRLPVLTIEQIARVLQKTPEQVYGMSRARAKRPLPVFRSGKVLCSTWAKIQAWVEEGFEERAA
jgi:hypothetical protein